MTRVYVSIGSNVDPERRMLEAARALRVQFPDVRFSPCYRNTAFGFEGADFINAVLQFDTELAIEPLIDVLHAIEEAGGRRRDDPRYGPRAMDLDLLLYGDWVGSGPGYVLPRRDLTRRVYMLGPMADLAPQYRLPPDGPTIAELWQAFAERDGMLKPVALDLNLT